MSTITDLERKVQSLSDQLAEARKSLEDARYDTCPIKAGDVVSNERGEIYRVKRISFWSGGDGWVMGNTKRKDGTFGTADRNVGCLSRLQKVGA